MNVAARGRGGGVEGGAAPGAADQAGAFSGPVRHVYVHVPYCRARCDYCDFASQALGDPDAGGRRVAGALDAYVEGVAAEWAQERTAHDVVRLRTLYLGGGTPSLLGPERLERLLDLFRPFLTRRAEVTVEANPEDVDEAFAAWAAAAPVAGGAGAGRGLRVSLGVQSFAPRLRRVLGRRAQADPAEAFLRLRRTGAADLSVDLIHGIPGQTPADVEVDLVEVLALSPDHVSWYELTPAEGTALARRLTAAAGGSRADGAGIDEGARGPGEAADRAAATPDTERDADEAAARYRRIVRALSRAGYDWYEVSNFARPGHRARHNLAYWRARPYLGLGPGAVSTVGARRWTDLPDPAAWQRALVAAEAPPRAVEHLDAATRARERLLLAARCGAPVPLPDLAAQVDPAAVAALAAAGLVSAHGGTLTVTRKGRYVAGEVCVRLFRA